MKALLRNINSFLLILILLGSTLQLSIYKMECLMSGITNISLSDFEDCNSQPKNGCSITEKCCCFHQMDLDFDFDSNIQNDYGKVLTFPVIALPLNVLNKEIIEIPFLPLFQSLPPPSGYSLLKLVQVFRL